MSTISIFCDIYKEWYASKEGMLLSLNMEYSWWKYYLSCAILYIHVMVDFEKPFLWVWDEKSKWTKNYEQTNIINKQCKSHIITSPLLWNFEIHGNNINEYSFIPLILGYNLIWWSEFFYFLFKSSVKSINKYWNP